MVLTSYETLNCEDIRFSDTFKGTYKTIIPIGIRDEEDNIIPLILSTPSNLLTFGVQEITDKEKNNIIGYQLPICLWGKKRITNEELNFDNVEIFNGDWHSNMVPDTKIREFYNSSSLTIIPLK